MRRLHLIAFAYADRGHTKEYVGNFCKRLKNDFDIILHIASKEIIDIPPGIKTNYIGVDIAGVKAENFLKYGRFSNFFKNLSKQRLIVKYSREIVKNAKITERDCVYVMDYTAFSLYFLFKGLRKINPKSYLWIHSARFESKDFVYALYKKMVKFIFNTYVAKTISGIVVNGDYIKTRLSNYLDFEQNKIVVIQYPSEISFKRINKYEAREILGLDKHEEIVLFFGGLRHDKNIEELIISTAEAQNKPLLIIAGSESTVSKEQVVNWLKKHNHTNYFLDISYVTEEKMALYYSCSDVLLLTYNSESASQSGPLSLAREFVLPAIVTDAGEIGYYVKINGIGLVASPSVKDDFKNKVEEFFKIVQESNFDQNLKIAKAKYSWDNAAKTYTQIFS